MGESGDTSDQGVLEGVLAAGLGGVPGWEGAWDLDLRRLTGGASRVTWEVKLSRPGEPERRLVAQVGRWGADSGRAVQAEAGLLEVAARAGVPVPQVVLMVPESALGAALLVTDFVEGETIPRRVLRDPQFESARGVLARQAGRALGRLHGIDPQSVVGLVDSDPVAEFGALLKQLGQPQPVLELALRQLDRRRPNPSGAGASTAPRLVHGDFRTGNLMVGPEGLRAVLDWELAHLGDPLEDLGWFCARAWRFGSAQRAGGFGSVDELVAGYREGGGGPVDPAALDWWEAMGTLKWGVMCILQARTHTSGTRRSVELAAIGRRVCETEWDLLGLLWPEGSQRQSGPVEPAVDTDPAGGQVHDPPGISELLEAVGGFLETEAVPALVGAPAFHARVAVRVLDQVRREIELGPTLERRHRVRLARLGVEDAGELVAAIRSGAHDADPGSLAQSLRGWVADKLAVANPRYADP